VLSGLLKRCRSTQPLNVEVEALARVLGVVDYVVLPAAKDTSQPAVDGGELDVRLVAGLAGERNHRLGPVLDPLASRLEVNVAVEQRGEQRGVDLLPPD